MTLYVNKLEKKCIAETLILENHKENKHLEIVKSVMYVTKSICSKYIKIAMYKIE